MTDKFFVDLPIIIAGYFILALSYLGFGWFCSRILKIRFPSEHQVFSLIWLGWAFTLFFLQILHLIFPINIYVSVPILLLGLVSVIHFFKTEIRAPIPPLSRSYFALMVIAVMWMTLLAMAATTLYDDGLYNFNTIRWFNESPIVLGLGNVHGRLAFNQTSLVYAAYLNFYPVFNHGHNLANSFLLLLLLAECLFHLSKYLNGNVRAENPSSANLISIFFIFPLLHLALYWQLPSPTANNTAFILQILLFLHFVRALGAKPSNPHEFSQILFIFILSATAITVKLSSLFYVLSICLILLFVKRKSFYGSPKQITINMLKLLAIPAFIVIVWSLRGILLSGCPAYPSSMGCMNVPWAVPDSYVEREANWIYAWSRWPNHDTEKVLSSWDWLRPWFRSVVDGNPFTVNYPVMISLLCLIVVLILYMRQPAARKVDKVWFSILIPIFVAFLFWFFIAPDLRFTHSLFWILPVATVFILLQILETSGKLNTTIIVLLFLASNINIPLDFISYPFMRSSLEGFQSIPAAALVEKQTASGLTVLVPARGDQCWDSKIPCTPYFDPSLSYTNNGYFPRFTTTDPKE